MPLLRDYILRRMRALIPAGYLALLRIRRLAPASVLYLVIAVLRGIRGLDQIPSDPGHSAIAQRIGNPLQLLAFQPYLHSDQLTIASIVALAPIWIHGFLATLITHIVWAICGTVIYLSLVRLEIAHWVSYVAGLILMLCPWAAQSSLGNFGNTRWPILVAVVVMVVSELVQLKPNVVTLSTGSCIAAITNPLAVVLVIPSLVSLLQRRRDSMRYIASVTGPVIAVLILNISMNGFDGHEAKVTTLWEGSGLFWSSGVFLPPALATIGIVFSLFFLKLGTSIQNLCLMTFGSALATALLSYQLGGIADRYFVTPAVLSGIGLLLLVSEITARYQCPRLVILCSFGVVAFVPSWKWFSVFPYLSSAPRWSTQVDNARQFCDEGETLEFRLITSDGITETDPLPCELLE